MYEVYGTEPRRCQIPEQEEHRPCRRPARPYNAWKVQIISRYDQPAASEQGDTARTRTLLNDGPDFTCWGALTRNVSQKLHLPSCARASLARHGDRRDRACRIAPAVPNVSQNGSDLGI